MRAKCLVFQTGGPTDTPRRVACEKSLVGAQRQGIQGERTLNALIIVVDVFWTIYRFRVSKFVWLLTFSSCGLLYESLDCRYLLGISWLELLRIGRGFSLHFRLQAFPVLTLYQPLLAGIMAAPAIRARPNYDSPLNPFSHATNENLLRGEHCVDADGKPCTAFMVLKDRVFEGKDSHVLTDYVCTFGANTESVWSLSLAPLLSIFGRGL